MNNSANPHFNREQCLAALDEFGFCLVELNLPGAPTPGCIADRLSDIHAALEIAALHNRMDEVVAATKQLRRLLLALDAYDGGMQHPEAYQ